MHYVNHLGAFVSTFNIDAISDVKLIKGGFPARYGGRLSSVLDKGQSPNPFITVSMSSVSKAIIKRCKALSSIRMEHDLSGPRPNGKI